MKNRKKGFSLVELLIVLAVMAALIATITPVALNAIKKSKATQVAQNLKTLASALENAAYVNGLATDGAINTISTLSNLGRDIDSTKYGVAYAQTGGSFTAVIYYIGADADINVVDDIIPLATSKAPSQPNGTYSNTLGAVYTTTGGIYYQIVFTVY